MRNERGMTEGRDGGVSCMMLFACSKAKESKGTHFTICQQDWNKDNKILHGAEPSDIAHCHTL